MLERNTRERDLEVAFLLCWRLCSGYSSLVHQLEQRYGTGPFRKTAFVNLTCSVADTVIAAACYEMAHNERAFASLVHRLVSGRVQSLGPRLASQPSANFVYLTWRP